MIKVEFGFRNINIKENVDSRKCRSEEKQIQENVDSRIRFRENDGCPVGMAIVTMTIPTVPLKIDRYEKIRFLGISLKLYIIKLKNFE